MKGRFKGDTEYQIFNPKQARIGSVFQLKDAQSNLYAAKPCDNFSKKRFQREALQYFEMDPHRNVLTICDVAHVLHMQQDLKLLVTPWATVGNLRQCLCCTTLTNRHRVEICIQIASGIEHLHSLNPPMIHQNLKPENVLMFIENDHLVAKVSDFGIMASGSSGIKLVSGNPNPSSLDSKLPHTAQRSHLTTPAKSPSTGSPKRPRSSSSATRPRSATSKDDVSRRASHGGGSERRSVWARAQKLWASPEQQPGSVSRVRITTRSDVYSMGMLFIWALGKEEENMGFAESFAALHHHHQGIVRKIKGYLMPYGWTTSRKVQSLGRTLGNCVSRFVSTRPSVRALKAVLVDVLGPKKLKPFKFELRHEAPQADDARGKKRSGSEKQIMYYKFMDSMLNNRTSSVAYKFYKTDALKGDAKAQFNLANCYNKGIGMARDAKMAVKWYTASAVQGNPEAQNALALCYERGTGVDRDAKAAFAWYTRAAAQGYALAEFNLGLCYERGIGTEPDSKAAVTWYRQSAEQGNYESLNNLGLCYERGRGVELDQKQAYELYLASAKAGSSMAQFNLALCYQKGIGVHESELRAVEWYTKSAEQGFAPAQCNLAVFFQQGIGAQADELVAVKWYTTAAAQGYAEAQNNLALCYQFGIGVPQDLKLAAQWFTEASLQGYAEAQFNLATAYAHGRGVERSEDVARQWLEEAAARGHPDAAKYVRSKAAAG